MSLLVEWVDWLWRGLEWAGWRERAKDGRGLVSALGWRFFGWRGRDGTPGQPDPKGRPKKVYRLKFGWMGAGIWWGKRWFRDEKFHFRARKCWFRGENFHFRGEN